MTYLDPDSEIEFPSYEEYERQRREYLEEQAAQEDEERCDHSYAGNDGEVGRCFCGLQLFPQGGPEADKPHHGNERP